VKKRIVVALIAVALFIYYVTLVAAYSGSPATARPTTSATSTETVSVTKSVYVTSTSVSTAYLTTSSTTYVNATITQTVGSTVPPGPLNFALVVSCPGCTNSTTDPQYYSGTILNGTAGDTDATVLAGESTEQVAYTFIAQPSQYLSGTWSISWQVLLYSSTGTLELRIYSAGHLFLDRTTDPSTGYLDGKVQVTVS